MAMFHIFMTTVVCYPLIALFLFLRFCRWLEKCSIPFRAKCCGDALPVWRRQHRSGTTALQISSAALQWVRKWYSSCCFFFFSLSWKICSSATAAMVIDLTTSTGDESMSSVCFSSSRGARGPALAVIPKVKQIFCLHCGPCCPELQELKAMEDCLRQ